MTSRPERLAERITPTLLLLLALGSVLLIAAPRRAGAHPNNANCKPNRATSPVLNVHRTANGRNAGFPAAGSVTLITRYVVPFRVSLMLSVPTRPTRTTS